IEGTESIIEIHPETFEVLREFSIPRKFDGRTLLGAGGEGIEAITFIPDADHKEGGVFYVANQAFVLSNEEDISALFEVEVPLVSKTGQVRITGYFEPGVIDLSGLYYDPATDHVFVVSDATNMILEYSRGHELLSVHAFPGDNQEGITVDSDGYIYIAQDTGGILKLKWLR
ncbi:MAG: SdiA-regulated domain-containing protein, partial [Planctomycetes bacterium]|nr:SdiA-regulated domain-containing protein [Planctomycetota bacterium]